MLRIDNLSLNGGSTKLFDSLKSRIPVNVPHCLQVQAPDLGLLDDSLAESPPLSSGMLLGERGAIKYVVLFYNWEFSAVLAPDDAHNPLLRDPHTSRSFTNQPRDTDSASQAQPEARPHASTGS